MTKRIVELAAQATKAVEKRPNTGICIMEEYNAKFAELIVRDVIYVLQMGMTRDGHSTPANLRTKKEMEHLLLHFEIPRDYGFVPEE